MTMVPLGWIGIVRLGLVQTALGSIVVLTTSTLNRVMVVELALPAILPGVLVALHYLIQVMRPRLGHGSDSGGKRTPWIIGGMAVLACGGVAAAVATAWMVTHPIAGIVLAVFAFAAIGIGVGASGTALLVLLAKRVEERRRAAAATIVWMMIVGFAVTAMVAGQLLDPFSPARLVAVTSGVSIVAFTVALVAVWNVEDNGAAAAQPSADIEHGRAPFREALRQVWAEPQARRFTIFVFVSMLAYSAQDLILEPFAGTVFGLTPGESTKLSGVQHGGVLVGMLLVALAGSAGAGHRLGSLRAWTIGGCLASGAALLALVAAAFAGPEWPLRPSVFALGIANGAFAVAAIGSMMSLASTGRESREGVRMGLWGAAQAVAFGLGDLAGTAASDLARYFLGSPARAYALVFLAEAIVFVLAAVLAARVGQTTPVPARVNPAPGRGAILAPSGRG
jgi:MFS transporter, BCD family, chlorophyll transporter